MLSLVSVAATLLLAAAAPVSAEEKIESRTSAGGAGFPR